MRRLAIFDFDGTLFRKQTIPFLVKQYGVMGHSPVKKGTATIKIIIEYLKYKIGVGASKEQFRKDCTQIFLTMFKEWDDEMIQTFFDASVDSIVEYLNQDVLKELEKAKADGLETILLSGAFNGLLHALASRLGFDMYYGTELNFDANGVLDLTKAVNVASGEMKVVNLSAYTDGVDVDWDNSYAYGDSHFDYGVLKMVGNPVAVNPDDQLRKIALERHWKIID